VHYLFCLKAQLRQEYEGKYARVDSLRNDVQNNKHHHVVSLKRPALPSAKAHANQE